VVISAASRTPAMLRRRNPIAFVRGLLVAVSRVWCVFGEAFMASIVHPAAASQ